MTGTAGRLDRSGYRLVLQDDFDGDGLDPGTWLPFHLPHWSSRAAAAARYELGGGLRLRIDANQGPWCPEFDGELRVSSLQTGVCSGPVGGTVGQHRFSARAVVRREEPLTVLLAPRYGLFEMRARAVADPDCMVALWMIGVEDVPERSGEICIVEIFGREVAPDHALIGMGVHPFGDPHLTDDFAKVRVDVDVREVHDYAAEWTPERVRFYVDEHLVRTVEQSPGYPMQFMLGLYEFRDRADPPDGRTYPKEFAVERFRVHARGD
jgi:hypothetical protein